MYRSLVTIVAVAAISCCLAQLEHARGQRTAWVRTVDGWEPSGVLRIEPRPLATPGLHPLLVAGFQLGTSVFALLAFSNDKRKAKPIAPETGQFGPGKRAGRRRRSKKRAKQASVC